MLQSDVTVTQEALDRALEPMACRLSTNARTLGEMVLRAGEKHSGVALRKRTGDRWTEVSYPALTRSARDIARGLIALGIEPGDHVSILANTRPEWTVADMGVFCAGAVVVPIYHTNSPRSASTSSLTPARARCSATTPHSSRRSRASATRVPSCAR